MIATEKIRNFAIIAHIDHGKSTLADRFLEITGVVARGNHEEQILDRNPISRERGITIKLAPVRMNYQGHTLNLVDTPGHVDFSYEVERTLSCVEGVILLVDATQGIQAQTIAHAYKAFQEDLIIIPAVNKIDLANAEVEQTATALADFLGVSANEIYQISAKTGQGVTALLEAVINKIPPPKIVEEQDTKALIFDSYYDLHQGVIAFVRLFSGSLAKRDLMRLSASGSEFEVVEVGTFAPELKPTTELVAGEIGYVVTNLKDIHLVRVGDTLLSSKSGSPPLPGYKKIKPMIFASCFPTDADKYQDLKKALEKLYLNDSALIFEPIYSKAFGGGFRVGFLGLLHADVTRERLEREFGQSLILTPPKVEYKSEAKEIKEPYAKVTIVTPNEYLGAVLRLCDQARGIFKTMDNRQQIVLVYEMPLNEIISNFFDNLKTVTSGYASLDWEFLEYRKVNADKLEVLLNNEVIEEFSEIVVYEKARDKANTLVKRIKEVIPKQLYEVRIQAKYKGKIIASERIAPYRKDVTAKLYGGDRTRKDKLLEKQKKGKKLMKQIGKVEIPKEAFLKLFKL